MQSDFFYKNTFIGVLIYTFSAFFQPALGQDKVTLSGYVKDATSGETLIGATIYDKANRSMGGISNVYGFYSLTLPSGNYTLTASYLGYQAKEIPVNLTENITLNIELLPEGILIEAVEVTAKRQDENTQSTSLGKSELSIETIKSLPALFGEVDVVRSLQTLPGVMSAGDANAGLYVRGGGPDQNLVLLDEAVVYNIGHLFGFFSVFNADAIKNTTLYTGSMPAQYGGRLSSVLDVTMKEGNNKKYQVDGGIGSISSRLTIQGPIQKDKSSFLISGRRTYADILAKPFLKGTDYEGNGYYFYDLNLKANYSFSDKDRLFLSGYFGRDVFNIHSTDGLSINMPWGNATSTLRWNHVFSSKIFMNLSAIYNAYDFGANTGYNNFSSKFYSSIRDWNGKLDFNYYPNVLHNIKFGLNYTRHAFTPYSVEAQVGEAEINTDLNKRYAHEIAVYGQDDWTISDKLQISLGLRTSGYLQVGPYKQTVFDENEIPIDTIDYATNEVIASYGGIEPRASFRYNLTSKSSIKGGVAVSTQYIHLVSNSTTTLPTDLWVPSTSKVKPQRGIQYALGYFQNFADDKYEASIEAYYKTMKNQIEFSPYYVPELNVELENRFVFGSGRAYGVGLFFKKRLGKFNGWGGYTLSRTERSFPDIDNGKMFPARYDRTHDLSAVAIYDMNKKWTFAATFVYGTGQATTLPNSFFVINSFLFTDYDMPRNSYRLKPYHRLDLSATWRLMPDNKRFYADLNFSIYNVYSRLNPFFVYAVPEFPENTDNSNLLNQPINVKLKQVSLFPIIPSITFNFKY